MRKGMCMTPPGHRPSLVNDRGNILAVQLTRARTAALSTATLTQRMDRGVFATEIDEFEP